MYPDFKVCFVLLLLSFCHSAVVLSNVPTAYSSIYMCIVCLPLLTLAFSAPLRFASFRPFTFAVVLGHTQTTDVMYHPQTGTFASVASTGIKLWDARTGRLTRTYGVPPLPTKLSSGGRWMKPRGVGVAAAAAVLPGKRSRFSRVVVGGRRVASGQPEEITR